MSNIQIDPSKSAAQNLLDMIDSLNTGAPTDPNEVTIGTPSAITVNGALNTQVTLTGTDTGTTHFDGSVTVNYGRLALADEAASPSAACEIPNGTTDAAAILALVATHYGFVLSEISWVTPPTTPEAFPSDSSADVQCANSLLYQDGTATVNLHWD